MEKLYNEIAGKSLERLAGLSDGVFAFAMTLLVLEVHIPSPETVHSEADLWRALADLTPCILTWLMSFMTLGIFWVGQQTQLNHLREGNRNFAWLNLAFLAAITTVPFTTDLLASYIRYRSILLVYWSNILLLGMLVFATWSYTCRAKLLKKDFSDANYVAVRRRILVAQTLYAFGALLCSVNTYWSIVFILFVQLNYAFAPRILAKWTT